MAPAGSSRGTAFVTGASEGIGRAIAGRLAADGFRVALVARPSARLDAAAAELGDAGFAVGADVSQLDEIERAIDETAGAHGGLAAVVNCASLTRFGTTLSLSDADWVAGFEVKVLGALRTMRAAWPHLVASGGSIVNIGGIGARTPRDATAMSGPLSAALLALTKTFADRGIKDGVRVNAVNPGAILTPRLIGELTIRAEAEGVTLDEHIASMERRDEVRRLGRPEDIAEVVSFLLSPAASLMQGAILDVDGGRTKGL